MGLREAVQAAVGAAFKAVDNVALKDTEAGTYLSYTSTVRNASAGASVPQFSTVAGVVIIMGTFSIREQDGNTILPTDRRGLIERQRLSTVTPKVQDRVVADGDTWTVNGVDTDAAKSIWKLHLRRL